MKSKEQLFEENKDLVEKFSYQFAKGEFTARSLMPITEKYLKKAIVLYGNKNLMDFYYSAERYIVDHLGTYIDSGGRSIEWSEERIQRVCSYERMKFARKFYWKDRY